MPGHRLAQQSSPYLRMHAENPVEWFPWGEEAFTRARIDNKPIFLSIGYYTCHWCHVMEQESFSDPAVAEILNRNFVSIKVDREERPDVDRVYMAYVQATTGGGGWPLSVFLTPTLKPFYGGTYFPPTDRFHLPSFSRLLESVAHSWREEPEKAANAAAQAGSYLAQAMQPANATSDEASPQEMFQTVWPQLFQQLRSSFDDNNGGFGPAPKFPRASAFHFLLRYARRHRGSEAASLALHMVATTLHSMARGGIHDVIGGGFHRYATDAGWLVPHFEKMLYDQALLTVSYLEAWQLTGEADFAVAASSILDFVLRELQSPEAGFFSAQDADSPLPESQRRPGGPATGEGAYYLWTRDELAAALGGILSADAIAAFASHYHVEAGGNIPPGLDPHGEFQGRNILHGENRAEFDAARQHLYQIRRQRPHPPRDEKILTAWNGLMISALALGARALNEPRYLKAAQAAAHFLERERWTPSNEARPDLAPAPGLLLRTASIAGFAEDYAFLVQALLDLYQADFDLHWLEWARSLQQALDARFAAPGGGYFSTAPDPDLYLRVREEYDGAEPSPNSVAASNLHRLSLWFPDDHWAEKAERLLTSFSDRLLHQPETLPLMAATLEAVAAPPRRLLITGPDTSAATQALLNTARTHFLPNYDVMRDTRGEGGAAAYLCNDFTCQLPIHDPARLAAALEEPEPPPNR